MLEKHMWDEIVRKASMYKHTSMNYIEYEDIIHSDMLKNDGESVILVDKSVFPNMLYFSTNEVEKMLYEIDGYGEELRVNFVPHGFIGLFQNHGFIEWAEYVDFFNEDLQDTCKKFALTQKHTFLNPFECDMASDMSKKCENQSRGFRGESAEWFANWIKENDTIVLKENNKLIGFSCVSIYANGTTLWIREIAVAPRYQGRGFGKKLMEQSIKYGVDRGAKRGFLAADVLNKNAICLYNSYGYAQKDARGELQMIRTGNSTLV